MLLLDDKIGDINKNDKELQDELLYIYSKMSYFWRGKYGTPLHEYFRLIVNKENIFKFIGSAILIGRHVLNTVVDLPPDYLNQKDLLKTFNREFFRILHSK